MLRKFLFLAVTASLLSCLNAYAWGAKKIIIKTIPEPATISVDGQEVGEGSYTVKFDGGNEFYVIKVTAPGYMEKSYRLLKSNPKNTVVYTLREDEAYKASSGGDSEDGSGMDIANQWMDITCRRGLSEDVIWKRLMSVCTSYFNNIEVRDKSAGWIKTAWRVTRFTNQTVRSRLEIRMSFTDDDVISYRARIVSEIKDNECTTGQNCFKTFPRLLKVLEPLIDELQTTVGGGE